jgi:hypothetical protein
MYPVPTSPPRPSYLLYPHADAAARKAAVHTLNRFELLDGQTIVLEHVTFMYFNDDDSKISRIVSHVDPADTKR